MFAIVPQIVGVTLQIVQVCTPNPEYLAAKAANMPAPKIMLIQPAKCTNTGHQLLGKKYFWERITQENRDRCQSLKWTWNRIAAQQGATVTMFCMVGPR